MADAADLVTMFERNVERLTVDDWKRVYDARPLGYGSVLVTSRDHYMQTQAQAALDAHERLIAVLERTLGDPDKAEAWGGGRVNFLSYCMERISNALDAIGNRDVRTPDSFVAGYGPFLQVIPPSALGIVDEIAELSDPAVRTPMIERYADLLKSLHGRQTAADAHLTDDVARIGLALCLESVGVSDARRVDLEEMYVALCAFPSVAASADVEEGDAVRSCENARLQWLGYTSALPRGERLTIGSGAVRAAASEDATIMTITIIGGLVPPAAMVVAALVATGGRLDPLGWLGAFLVGASGLVIGLPVYLMLSARTRSGSVQRTLAFAVSVLLMIAVSAICGYLYIGFVTR